MKSKYIVYTGRERNGSNKAVKTFKNEPEAMAFISADKNLLQYGDMILRRRDSSGNEYIWNDSKRTWEAA